MGNSNQGKVIGKNYVGGVIGKNEVEIAGTETNGVGVTNSGMVIATAGGAGGIIGENSANISYTVMKNEGEVHGNASENGTTQENGTGGIIGVNGENSSITNSSMMNALNGQVTGISNVGGLIGINHGTVTGGRDSKDGYYQHQIYNNGTIQAGSYDEKTGKLNQSVNGSENIGGLMGANTGSLTAGYNTGVIAAGSSTNVGGIAGSNSGTIDQVFTNVMTENGKGETITGASNVGGIVGNNSTNSKISNAYTAKDTSVKGTTSGLIAGTNGGTISNVYGANKDQLVGNGTKATNGYGMSNQENDYKGFDFTGNDNKSAVWKIYEDHTNPLLKVFLTKASVSADALKNLVYNGQNQLDIDKLISSNTFTNQKDNHNFADYHNSSSLLQSNAKKDAGNYTNWLWSAQIGKNNTGDFNPNNLGYDFTVGEVSIAKAQLTLSLDDVYRIYGNGTMYKDGTHTTTVDYSTLWHLDTNGMTEAMKEELLTNKGLSVTKASDGAIDDLASGKTTTKNVGNYDLFMNVSLSDAVKNNYTVDSSITKTGGSHVDKADLNLTVGNVETTYGTQFNSSKYGYTLSGNTNGDTEESLKNQLQVGYTNKAAKDGTGGKWTGDAGTYNIGINKQKEELDRILTNYNVTVKNGTATVKKADLYVKANHVYSDGKTSPNYTGSVQGWVNGDTGRGYTFAFGGPAAQEHEKTPGTYVDSIWVSINGTWHEKTDTDITNYHVHITPGTLTVKDRDEEIEHHWDYLFHDTPWDKNWNERERKAEIHFVSGGMRY